MVSLGREVGDKEDVGDSHVVDMTAGVRHGHKAFAFALDGHPKTGYLARSRVVKVNHLITDAIVVLIGTTIANPTVCGDGCHTMRGRTGGS